MNRSATLHRLPPGDPQTIVRRLRARGFSFIEIMFAICILGIGAILVASMFPVAIAQARLSHDESTAAVVGRSALARLSASLRDEDVPIEPGAVRTFNSSDALWNTVKQDLIVTGDTRYAFIPLYRRDSASPVAQIFVIVMRVQNQSRYEPGRDLSRDPNDIGNSPATLEPKAVRIRLTDGGSSGPDVLEFPDASDPNTRAAVEGAYVIVATGGAVGETAGRVYRIGNPIDLAANRWELAPGNDMRDATENLTGIESAYIVGRGWIDAQSTAQGFEGPAQDIALFTTFVMLH